jgi:hypothetical protein
MNIVILLEIQHQKTGADSPLNRSGLSEYKLAIYSTVIQGDRYLPSYHHEARVIESLERAGETGDRTRMSN